MTVGAGHLRRTGAEKAFAVSRQRPRCRVAEIHNTSGVPDLIVDDPRADRRTDIE
jgi:hypothetical protein